MSFNAFMLPALPQAPTAGLNSPRQVGSTDSQSCRPDETTAGGQSFTATLNQISNNTCDRSREVTRTENTAGHPDHADANRIIPEETNKPVNNPQVGGEDTGISESAVPAACIHPLQALGLIQQQFFNFLMSAAVNDHPDPTPAETLPVFEELGAPILPEGQPIQNGQVGIGLFEQLQANVSPDATQLYFFEQLVAGKFNHQNSPGAMGIQTHIWGYWSWMTNLSAGNPNAPADPVGSHATPGLPHLLHLQGVDTPLPDPAAQSEAVSEQKPTAQPTVMGLNGEWRLKAIAPSQQNGSNISKNALTTSAGNTQAGHFSSVAAGLQNSAITAETKLQHEANNSQMHRLEPTDKPSDQKVSSQFTAQVVAAKPAEEAFNLKGDALKSQMTLSAEAVDKVIQIEGENKDSSLLYGQDQMSERLAKFETATPTSESTPRSLASQTMNQIVQRAVLSMNNGQNEVRIDLKPEFLGHIRMQIVTESQQIAVKMIADSPFVKDMLDSNLNQLKADLQAHGLKVDELEVSVAHDSHTGAKNQTPAGATKSSVLREDTASGEGDSEEQNESQVDGSESMAENAIDYFA